MSLSGGAGSAGRSLSLLALLLGLLAAWLLWSGVRQWQAGASESGLLAQRDRMVQQTSKAMNDARRKVAQAAGDPSVQIGRAMAAIDMALATQNYGAIEPMPRREAVEAFLASAG